MVVCIRFLQLAARVLGEPPPLVVFKRLHFVLRVLDLDHSVECVVFTSYHTVDAACLGRGDGRDEPVGVALRGGKLVRGGEARGKPELVPAKLYLVAVLVEDRGKTPDLIVGICNLRGVRVLLLHDAPERVAVACRGPPVLVSH